MRERLKTHRSGRVLASAQGGIREHRMPPTHPGEILREDVLPELGISVSEFARRIGVSRQILHRILARTHGVTPRDGPAARAVSREWPRPLAAHAGVL